MAKKKPKTGRPPAIPTDEQIKMAGTLAHKQIPQIMIAHALGIGETTFYKWMRLGQKETEGPFAQFAASLKKGRVFRLADLLDRIYRVGAGGGERAPTWQALAWLVERGFPDQFALARRTSIVASTKGKNGGSRVVVRMGPEEVPEPVDDVTDDEA